MADAVFSVDAGRDYTVLGIDYPRQIEVRLYVPSEPGDYPVIFYSHGSTTNPGIAEATPEALAAQGYIVVAPMHLDSLGMPLTSLFFPRSNPQSTVERVLDMKALGDQAASFLPANLPEGYTANLDTPIIAGHSQGAFTAQLLIGTDSAQAAFAGSHDPFFEAAILISPQGVPDSGLNQIVGLSKEEAAERVNGEYWTGVYYEDAQNHSWTNVTVPVLTLTGTADDGDAGQTVQHRKDAFEFSPSGAKHLAVIDGANHFDMGTGGASAEVGEVAGDFLDAYVKGDTGKLAALNDVQNYAQTRPWLAEIFEKAGNGTGFIRDWGSVRVGADTDDVILAGPGTDSLTGGGGNDVFVFNPGDSGVLALTRDKIRDFDDNGDDVIDLTGFGSLTYIGSAAFTAAGQVRAIQSGDHVLVQINTTGTGIAESVIELSNTSLSQIGADDFWFA